MSYSPGSYVPPPPGSAVRRGKSPWFFVGMGCLGLVLLTLGIVGYAAYRVVSVVNRPVTNEEIIQSFGDKFPIYPKAKLDKATSKIMQGTSAVTQMITGKQGFAAAVFRVPVSPDDVVGWYDVELGKRGFVPTKARQPSIGQKMENQVMHQYFKKDVHEMVMVQAGIIPEDKKTDPADATMLVLMRMTNVSGKSVVTETPEAPAKK